MAPNRLEAAKVAGERFAGTATMLVPPTTNRSLPKAIASVSGVIGGGDCPPPARIVLESDGKETVPSEPDDSRGAFTAARAAKDQGVPITSISFGTPDGYVTLDGQQVAVPVDDATLEQISTLSGGGQVFHADTLDQLNSVYAPCRADHFPARSPSRTPARSRVPRWSG